MVSLKIDEWPKCYFSVAKGQFLKTIHKQTGVLNSSFSREKSKLAEQYLAWTTVWIIKKGGKEFKLLKTSKERSRKSKTNHKRVKLPNYPLQRQSHPFEQMEQSALSIKKECNIFWCCKTFKFIILLIFAPISRVVVTLWRLIYSLLIVYTHLRRTYSFLSAILTNVTLWAPSHTCNFRHL